MIQQVTLSDKQYIAVGAYNLTYEEWQELCSLGPLLVTPFVATSKRTEVKD